MKILRLTYKWGCHCVRIHRVDPYLYVFNFLIQGNTPRAQALRAEDFELANFLDYQEVLQKTEGASTEV